MTRSDAEGDVISLDAGATDPDGDTLTYVASGLPAGLSIDAEPGSSADHRLQRRRRSPYSVSVTVRDGLTVDATDTFEWVVTNTNQDPTFDQNVARPGRTPRATSSASMPAPPIPTATP